MKVSELLAALPGIGKVKAVELMDEFEVAATRRLRGLGAQQKDAILTRFS